MADAAAGRAAIAYARTVLTMGHDAELLLPGRRAGQVRSVEDAGRPYLLLRHGPPPIAADTVAIRVAPVLPGQSELAVIAGLGEPGLAHSGTLAELMAGHRMCSGRDQPAGLFRPVPLTPRTVHRVRFTRPARHPHHFGSLLAPVYLDQSTSAE